jgi:hypothetical protein
VDAGGCPPSFVLWRGWQGEDHPTSQPIDEYTADPLTRVHSRPWLEEMLRLKNAARELDE